MNQDTIKYLEMALAAAKRGEIVGIGAIVVTTSGAFNFHYSGSQQGVGPFLVAGGQKITELGLKDAFPERKPSSLVIARPNGLPS